MSAGDMWSLSCHSPRQNITPFQPGRRRAEARAGGAEEVITVTWLTADNKTPAATRQISAGHLTAGHWDASDGNVSDQVNTIT